MGGGCVHPTPIPAFPLKGKEFLWKVCNTVQLWIPKWSGPVLADAAEPSANIV